MTTTIDVYLEQGAKRVFAGALDWPGWCRSARDEVGSLEALVTYGPRYLAVISGMAGEGVAIDFQPPDTASTLRVVERFEGDSGTDFGVPSRAPATDAYGLDPDGIDRQLAILRACWTAFDTAAAGAEGVVLRLGPRGGGRDLPRIRGHVLEADQAYLGQLGSRPPKGDGSAAHVAAHRAAVIETFTARALGRPVPDPRDTKTPWSPRYFVRRSAWHLLDHAWEIEDRATVD